MPRRKPDDVKAMLGTLRDPPADPRPTTARLSPIDQTLLDALLADRDRVRAELTRAGRTFMTPTGIVRTHPLVVQLAEIERSILRLSGRLTRGSRTLVSEGDPLFRLDPAERAELEREALRRRLYFFDETDLRALALEPLAGAPGARG